METYQIVILIAVPVILIFNASVAKKIRESHDYTERQKQNISDWIGKGGLVLLVSWLIFAAYLFFSPSKSTLVATEISSATHVPSESSKYSESAVTKAQARISKWQSEGILRLDLSNFEAFLSPGVWTRLNLKEKEEFFVTILIYAEEETGDKNRIFEIKSDMDGSVLASYTSISGFDFIPEK